MPGIAFAVSCYLMTLHLNINLPHGLENAVQTDSVQIVAL